MKSSDWKNYYFSKKTAVVAANTFEFTEED